MLNPLRALALAALPAAAFSPACSDASDPSLPLPDNLDTLYQSLPKGTAGSANGQTDYCTGGQLCITGEGDCDFNTECVAGTVCGNDNLDRYLQTVVCEGCEACTPPHCTNGLLDSASGETGVDCGGPCGQCSASICPIWPNGHTAHCSATCKCPGGEGDCDLDNHCQSGLVCRTGFATQFGLPLNTDVCIAPHCTNGRQDTASGEVGIDCGGPCGNCLWGSGPGNSCDAFDQNLCGPFGDENCCAAPSINTLADSTSVFNRNYDGVFLPLTTGQSAQVSLRYMDKFEVTVGRFRKFIEDFSAWRAAGNPLAGAGNHPVAPSSGWNSAWPLAANEATLRANLKCDPSYQTWSDTPGDNEVRPINCVNWYEAFAFCTWDGGRVFTEAEHNCAASGGENHRVYPWSSPSTSTTLTQSHANWDCGGNACSGTPNELLPAGSLPSDGARWSHRNLAGNVWEWVVDYWVERYSGICSDCALTTADSDWRVIRGGSWASRDPLHLLAGWRDRLSPDERRSDVGIRCAR